MTPPGPSRRGRLVVVVGVSPNQTAAVARSVASVPGRRLGFPTAPGSVVLVDLVPGGVQAADLRIRDPGPGVGTLVAPLPDPAAPGSGPHRPLARGLARRGQWRGRELDVVPGLRDPADWTWVVPERVLPALDALRSRWPLVVADAGTDLQGEARTGSPDVEDRNRLARSAVASADLVVVTSSSSPGDRLRTSHLLRELRALAVPPERVRIVEVRGRAARGLAPRRARQLVATACSTAPLPLDLRAGAGLGVGSTVRRGSLSGGQAGWITPSSPQQP